MITETKYDKDTLLFKKGDASDLMYRVVKGSVRIVNGYGTENEQEIVVLKDGSFIGEMGIIENAPRSTDAVAMAGTTVASIGFSDFEGFVKDDTDAAIFLMQTLSERLRDTDKKYLDAVKLLNEYYDEDEMEDSELNIEFKQIKLRYGRSLRARGLFSRVENTEIPHHSVNAGGIIFSEGDPGTIMYLILEGEVDFYLGYSGKQKLLIGSAKKGDIFGEMAVLDNEARSATAVASSDVELQPVTVDDLPAFLKENPKVAMILLKNLSGRIREKTSDYIDVLKFASDYVKLNSSELAKTENWKDMMALASYYNLLQTQPYMMH
ncbi:MAG: cyclic nucleotide-binding domain-containing protein [Lachnospiraceae bacterium]|jgi:CRP-like cAMP-binding protein|nr:cyclic nucleotide-binding domain-containing protein [Lachnospiraceae bacterium]